MATRREFVGAACAALAAPMILTLPARATPPRIRRDVMDLSDSDPFFGKYADAVRAMHQLPESDGRNWRRQARIHADFCRHSQIPFLHWHRHYITFFESICAELIGDSNFALPYWNWSKKNGVIPAAFFDMDALNVEFWNDPGIYSSTNWGPVDTVGKRGLAKGQGLLTDTQRGGEFTASNIDSIKRLPNIQLFEGRLEGSPHNNGRVVSGATSNGKTGHIGDGLSPLDPILWLHHCMVDRVWAEWQRAGNVSPDPGETYPDNFFDKSGVSKTVTAGGALDTGTLGYTYDVIEASAQPTGESGTQFVEITPAIEKAL
jgi:tyrosinase